MAVMFAAPAQAQDSMAQFRTFIENASPAAADMGAWNAPEIFAANHYPFMPAAGDAVSVRAVVKSFSGMAPYKVTDVSLTWWKQGGDKTTAPMKLIDEEQGIYQAALGKFASGEEVFYTVTAVDDWGNVSMELPPDGNTVTLVEDADDPYLNPAMDILAMQAAYSGDGDLRLCLKMKAKPERTQGNDMLAYGLFLFSNDVRFKPSLTETELQYGWLAVHLPAFSVSDMVSASDLMSVLAPGGKSSKNAKFKKKDETLCFMFDPSVVRKDYALGLKLAGAAIAVDAGAMAIKPTDATHAVMLYPTVHNFRAR